MKTLTKKQLTIDELKVNALVLFLDVDADEAQRLIDNDDYIVLTDEEADEKASESILDSVWAFRPSFLSSFTGFDESIFEAIQANDKCESNNPAILQLIDDKEGFVQEAISADGRGHFMSSYDGDENEQTINGTTFYIYRIN